MARGLDVGTCFLVGATQDPNGMADGEVKSIRDAFVDVENQVSTRNMLKMSKVNYIEGDDSLYILGDEALTIANMLKKEVRRPLKAGVISAGESEAEKILLPHYLSIFKQSRDALRVLSELVSGDTPIPVDREAIRRFGSSIDDWDCDMGRFADLFNIWRDNRSEFLAAVLGSKPELFKRLREKKAIDPSNIR